MHTHDHASVRYLVDDVDAAIEFYTAHLGFTLEMSAAPAFADVRRCPLRLLLSGEKSSGARATPPGLAGSAGPTASTSWSTTSRSRSPVSARQA